MSTKKECDYKKCFCITCYDFPPTVFVTIFRFSDLDFSYYSSRYSCISQSFTYYKQITLQNFTSYVNLIELYIIVPVVHQIILFFHLTIYEIIYDLPIHGGRIKVQCIPCVVLMLNDK